VISLDYSAPNSYSPKFLADKILTARSSAKEERKLVTVLFADAANFPAMSEKLDPEDVQQIMLAHDFLGSVAEKVLHRIRTGFHYPHSRRNGWEKPIPIQEKGERDESLIGWRVSCWA